MHAGSDNMLTLGDRYSGTLLDSTDSDSRTHSVINKMLVEQLKCRLRLECKVSSGALATLGRLLPVVGSREGMRREARGLHLNKKTPQFAFFLARICSSTYREPQHLLHLAWRMCCKSRVGTSERSSPTAKVSILRSCQTHQRRVRYLYAHVIQSEIIQTW